METKRFSRIILRLWVVLIVTVFASLTNQSIAQESKGNKPAKPDVKIKVNKEYDEKGNVTRYDSTYSYSWSGNGQFPSNIDSVFRGFNHGFEFGGNIDSMLNHMGFNWSLNGRDFFDQQLSQHNKHFEEFFRHGMLPKDSTIDHNHDFFGNDMQKMFKQQQQLMERFLKQFNMFHDSLLVNPIDTVPSINLPKNKIKPQNQNYKLQNQSGKTISV